MKVSLLNQIKDRLLLARKSKEGYETKALLTALYSEAEMVGKNASPPRLTTDVEVIAMVNKFMKGIQECQVSARDRRDSDWCDKLAIEEELLRDFLPAQMTECQLTVAIVSIINDNGITNLKGTGMVMRLLKEQFGGTYDGKQASDLVKAFLSSK
jgi:uncharacterized protein YqeY